MCKPKKLSSNLARIIFTTIFVGSLAIAPENSQSQVLQHDTGNGIKPGNAVSVPVNPPGLANNPFFNPTTGRIDGGGLFGEINITPGILDIPVSTPDGTPGTLDDTPGGPNTRRNIPLDNSTDPNSPNFDPSTSRTDSSGSQGDLPDNSAADPDRVSEETIAASQPREVTINEVAKLLETDLNQSLEQLATVESAVATAEEAPRRIARKRNLEDDTRACVNPAIQARKNVAEKLEQSQGFIEQVNQINPNDGLW